jgi:Prohead core protein serine protease
MTKPRPWPYRERRVAGERLRLEGVAPDPSWHYDRASDTYSPPVVRDSPDQKGKPLNKLTERLRESAAPAPSENLLREVRSPSRTNVTLTEAKNAAGKTITRFKCVVAQVDITNRNGKFYPRSAYQAAITAAADDLAGGKLWALIEHADDWFDPMKGRLEKIAGLFDTLSIEGDEVIGGGVIVDNASGRDVLALFDAGVAVGISTSGTASIKYLPAKEVDPTFYDPEALIGVVQDDYRLLTIDFVSDPANPAGVASREAAKRNREEIAMHPKIKALLEKYSVSTVDELKQVASAEYVAALEAIAKESTQPPAPRTSTASATLSP